jgi:ParB-like chromosome segregation protein Spo0J
LFAAEHELAGKQAEHNELRASVNVVLEEWQRLKRELAAAQQIEQRLTAQLEGKAYRDPKLGLYVAPTI